MVLAIHNGRLAVLRGERPPQRRGKTLEDVSGRIEDGREYTPDQIEFMLAMDRYKRDNRRPFPQWSEVLAVVKSLGYRKVEDAQGG